MTRSRRRWIRSCQGVEVLAEATEALVAGSAIRVPPAGLKYVIAALLVMLTAFVFFRGEPHNDIDSIFVATNLLLLSAAFIGLTFFAYFFDVFAAVGFVSLVFGLCRIYAKIQRGRAVGNGDYLPDFDPARDRWLAVARLHFVPDAGLDARTVVRRRREYRRRLRRFLYAGTDAVMLEGDRRGKNLAARCPERPRRADVARRERGGRARGRGARPHPARAQHGRAGCAPAGRRHGAAGFRERRDHGRSRRRQDAVCRCTS